MTDYLENGNSKAPNRLILAHGAGAAMDSPFMDYFARHLAGNDLHVVRFEFPYMQTRRQEGTKRPPDRQPKLLESWRKVIEDLGPAKNLIIGGKSMGGRMASMIADEANAKGLICLGYPFYAPGKVDKPRIDHLKDLKTRTLIAQGERDSMGNLDAVKKYTLSPSISYHWCHDGDHSFKPRKASGVTEEENWTAAIDAIKEFILSLG
jgi:predicted alpha/beta-hydrolase family hydrolase